MYLLPVLFLYLLLLPYQRQLLITIDETVMIRVFDTAQEYIILFEIWFQYLAFRFILSTELREVSYRSMRQSKGGWFICNLIMTLFLFLPYFVWLIFHIETYVGNVFILLMQCMIIAGMTFFFMQLLKSALGGSAIMVFYYFLCVNHLLPREFCVIWLGMLPVNYGYVWKSVQMIMGILPFGGGVWAGRE